MLVLYLALYFSSNVLYGILTKKCSDVVSRGKTIFQALCVIQNSVTAMIFFLCLTGFNIIVTPQNVLYGLAFSVTCTGNLLLFLYTLSRFDIADVTVFKSGGCMILTYVLGLIIFSEKITLTNAIQLTVIAAALGLVYYEQKSISMRRSDKNSAFAILMLVFLAVILAMQNLVNKLYMENSPDVTSSFLDKNLNSFFFFTNAFQFLFGIIGFLFLYFRTKPTRSDLAPYFKPINLCVNSVNTIMSNLVGLFSTLIIALMDMSVFSPISSAIGILAAGVSSLLVKEKPSKFSIIAMALSIVAVLLTLFV